MEVSHYLDLPKKVYYCLCFPFPEEGTFPGFGLLVVELIWYYCCTPTVSIYPVFTSSVRSLSS
ncbi:hypothetical protein P3S67_020445 [Capsicum chacoense]